MTIRCPNCRTDFGSDRLSTEKVNEVVCPNCRMIFPYTVKTLSLSVEGDSPSETVALAAEAALTPKKTAVLFGNDISGGTEEFMRLKELEEKRELMRRERELRYEQMALEYRLKLLEEKERLERREQERRRILEQMEGFIHVASVASMMPAESQAGEAEAMDEPLQPAVSEREFSIPVEEPANSETTAQAAFSFDKTSSAETLPPAEAQKPSDGVAALDFSADAAEELRMYEASEADESSETYDFVAENETVEAVLQPESAHETEAETETETETEAETHFVSESESETQEQLDNSGSEAQYDNFESDMPQEADSADEMETVVVEIEVESESETVAEIRLIEDEDEEDVLVVSETRLIEDEFADDLSAADAEISEKMAEVEAVVERVRLIEEQAQIHETPEENEVPAESESGEAPYYASGETLTEHGMARVIVTGVKLLDEESPAESADSVSAVAVEDVCEKDAEKDSVERFFAQVEDESECVSDSELEESLKADVDKVVSEIEYMNENGIEQVAIFEGREDDGLPESQEQVREFADAELDSDVAASSEDEPADSASAESGDLVSQSPEAPLSVAGPVPEKIRTEPIFAARPPELSKEEIQLRLEQEKDRSRATQQFYSSQFENIKMQRDVERRIIQEKERLAAEAAEQKNPAGTELSRMKRNLQIGAALFTLMVIAQILIYLFGGD